MSNRPTEEMLVQRQLRAAEIALESARRRRRETEDAIRDMRAQVDQAEAALAESEAARERQAQEHQAEMAAARALAAEADQRALVERNRRLSLDQQLSALRREVSLHDQAARQLAAEEQIRRLEGELELISRRAAEFEYGLRMAALDAFRMVRQMAARVDVKLGRVPEPAPGQPEAAEPRAVGPQVVEPAPVEPLVVEPESFVQQPAEPAQSEANPDEEDPTAAEPVESWFAADDEFFDEEAPEPAPAGSEPVDEYPLPPGPVLAPPASSRPTRPSRGSRSIQFRPVKFRPPPRPDPEPLKPRSQSKPTEPARPEPVDDAVEDPPFVPNPVQPGGQPTVRWEEVAQEPVRWQEPVPVHWQTGRRKPHEFGAAQRRDPPPASSWSSSGAPIPFQRDAGPVRDPDALKPPSVASVLGSQLDVELDSQIDSQRLDAALDRLKATSPPPDEP